MGPHELRSYLPLGMGWRRGEGQGDQGMGCGGWRRREGTWGGLVAYLRVAAGQAAALAVLEFRGHAAGGLRGREKERQREREETSQRGEARRGAARRGEVKALTTHFST